MLLSEAAQHFRLPPKRSTAAAQKSFFSHIFIVLERGDIREECHTFVFTEQSSRLGLALLCQHKTPENVVQPSLVPRARRLTSARSLQAFLSLSLGFCSRFFRETFLLLE